MRIVRELGLENSADTLGRWMSHRIAELMCRADQAGSEEESEVTRRECAGLILRVWERRKHWPHGQPLDSLSAFLKTVAPPPYSPRRTGGVAARLPWIKALALIRDLEEREYQIVLDAAIADLHLDKDREWLKEHPGELSEEEHKTITWVISQQERLRDKYYKLDGQEAPNFADMLPEERARLALAGLDKISSERQRIFAAVQKASGVRPLRKSQTLARKDRKK